MSRLERLAWSAAAAVLVAFAIPWFLWGSTTVVAGLPLWLWWHVGWMCLASVAFWVFAQRAWGIGIEPTRQSSDDGLRRRDAAPDGGDRS